MYAENAAAGMFSPRRAEHEFYTITGTAPLPPVGAVVVNELLADNATGQPSPAGTYDDWIELYNNTAAPVDLSGLYLTDDPTVRNKWVFPAGTTIGGNGFLIVWADNGTAVATDLHANFKLSKNGEYVILSDGGSAVLDSVGFGAQATDTTWGRFANGTGPWRKLPPTFNAVNQLPLGMSADVAPAGLTLYPNPAAATVTVTAPATAAPAEVVLTDLTGREVRRWVRPAGATTLVVPTADLPAGLYAVRVGGHARAKLVVR